MKLLHQSLSAYIQRETDIPLPSPTVTTNTNSSHELCRDRATDAPARGLTSGSFPCAEYTPSLDSVPNDD